MTLKISDPQKQKGVLNHWADTIEGRLNAIEKSGARTTSIASGGSSSSGGSTTPSGTTNSNVKQIVSNYTIMSGDSVLLVNASGAVTITLTATPAQTGQVWRIKNINTGLITLQPQSSQSVENLAFVTLPLQMQSFDILYDGANFWIL